MAINTDNALRRSVIYEVYVRSHTPEGTFKAIEPDLDRIAALGVDIVWFMPIHPIGELNKKGSLGCPYANRDYRTVNPEYGTLEDFLHLVEEIHKRGMKCIIDVVYNHTSPDSTLVAEHPDYFYYKPDGCRGNKVGDWTDVVDLNYENRALWQYQIDSLCYWAQYVDGFRCDVASTVPVAFWQEARRAVEQIRPGAIWLGESVHLAHIQAFREMGFYAATDTELFTAFDILYPYDLWPLYEDVTDRFPERKKLLAWTALNYFMKGTILLYAGQEVCEKHTPSLFEKEPVDWNSGEDISGYLAKLAAIKKKLPTDELFRIGADDTQGIVTASYIGPATRAVGGFPLEGNGGTVAVPLPDGAYTDALSGKAVTVADGMLTIGEEAVILLG